MGIKYKVNENFFKTWSKDSAYTLGFIYADGSLEDSSYIRGKYIRFSNTDRSLVERIRKAIGSSHKIVVIPAWGSRKEKYLLRIGSHRIYNDLEAQGLHPRKSLNMTFPRIPYRFLPDFVRGYFDGDGTIFFERINTKPYNRLKVIFTSGSKDFLLALTRALKSRCAGKLGRVYNSHRSYQLLYRSTSALKILKFIYNGVREKTFLRLDRKYNKYKTLISRPDIFRCDNLFDRSSRVWAYEN